MNSMNKLKAVMFDMDGLLIDSERMNIDCWKTIIDKENIDLDIQAIIDTTGSSGKEANEYLIRRLGREIPFDEIRLKKDRLFVENVEKNGIPLKRGVIELFDYLDQRHIRKLLVTSTFEEIASFLLKHADIYDRFDLKVFGSEGLRSKPYPDLYNKMKLMADLKSEDCLVLEDSENGIKASDNAGINVIGIPDMIPISHLRLPHLAAVKNDLLDVITYIEDNYHN